MAEITAPEEPFADAGDETEALLDVWLVEEGDAVAAGQAVAEATVGETQFQIEAPSAGTIGEIVLEAGNTFEVGERLAVMEEDEPGPA
jgi:2-oxoisovalerate dehydrogenase E2 component (dihydrolipoyl transacylase)